MARSLKTKRDSRYGTATATASSTTHDGKPVASSTTPTVARQTGSLTRPETRAPNRLPRMISGISRTANSSNSGRRMPSHVALPSPAVAAMVSSSGAMSTLEVS
mgnify:CR=1 FL=1